MRNLAILIAGVIGTVSGIMYLSAKDADCAYCPTFPCYGSCMSPCVCMVPPGQIAGSCVSFNRVSEYEEEGYAIYKK